MWLQKAQRRRRRFGWWVSRYDAKISTQTSYIICSIDQCILALLIINFRENTRSSRVSLRSTKSSTTLVHDDAPLVDPMELTQAAENLETNLEPQPDASNEEEQEANESSDHEEENEENGDNDE